MSWTILTTDCKQFGQGIMSPWHWKSFVISLLICAFQAYILLDHIGQELSWGQRHDFKTLTQFKAQDCAIQYVVRSNNMVPWIFLSSMTFYHVCSFLWNHRWIFHFLQAVQTSHRDAWPHSPFVNESLAIKFHTNAHDTHVRQKTCNTCALHINKKCRHTNVGYTTLIEKDKRTTNVLKSDSQRLDCYNTITHGKHSINWY